MRSKVAKVLALVMVAVMCMGMVAVAAPSPVAVTEVNKAVDKNNKDISGKVTINAMPEEYKEVAAAVKTEEGMKNALKQAGVEYSENLAVLDVVDVAVVPGESVEFPLTITFNVKGVTPSSKVVVLHWTGSAWESLDVVVGEGTVTVTFTSLSPVAFIVDKTTVSGGVSGTTSPKTSASSVSVIALLGLGAAVCVIGLKKKSVMR